MVQSPTSDWDIFCTCLLSNRTCVSFSRPWAPYFRPRAMGSAPECRASSNRTPARWRRNKSGGPRAPRAVWRTFSKWSTCGSPCKQVDKRCYTGEASRRNEITFKLYKDKPIDFYCDVILFIFRLDSSNLDSGRKKNCNTRYPLEFAVLRVWGKMSRINAAFLLLLGEEFVDSRWRNIAKSFVLLSYL